MITSWGCAAGVESHVLWLLERFSSNVHAAAWQQHCQRILNVEVVREDGEIDMIKRRMEQLELNEQCLGGKVYESRFLETQADNTHPAHKSFNKLVNPSISPCPQHFAKNAWFSSTAKQFRQQNRSFMPYQISLSSKLRCLSFTVPHTWPRAKA